MAGRSFLTDLLRFAIACAALSSGHGAWARGDVSSGPSFDCTAVASAIEKAICDDPVLAREDATMARLYALLATSSFGSGPSAIRADQRRWLQERKYACTGLGEASEVLACRRKYFAARNRDLAAAALLRDTALALDTLRRVDPGGAPLLEAIATFAVEPAGADWTSPGRKGKRDRIIALFTPIVRRLDSEEMWSYGKAILADEGISSASDAVASEAKFARFVQVASAYVDADPRPPVMPCDAIVRHPELLDATGPVFGSSLDNFIIRNDCAVMLPPTPALDKVIDAVGGTWGDCEGSIRYAYFRQFALAQDKARLGSRIAIPGTAALARRPGGLTSAQVWNATTELTERYRDYLGLSAKEAQLRGKAHVNALLSTDTECS